MRVVVSEGECTADFGRFVADRCGVSARLTPTIGKGCGQLNHFAFIDEVTIFLQTWVHITVSLSVVAEIKF